MPPDERRGYIGGSNVRRAVRRRWRTCTSRCVALRWFDPDLNKVYINKR